MLLPLWPRKLEREDKTFVRWLSAADSHGREWRERKDAEQVLQGGERKTLHCGA